ncbi:MAG TPA: class I poly(R)-hydroxyalkanoic acid synthase [Alphaproteobacteria bacterium]|jgi:polyhydroxyalkanoate synthase|nr:class I poly(R)-hydroxyalkanoic acid synthase [Alphaproteobacteria bacterium]
MTKTTESTADRKPPDPAIKVPDPVEMSHAVARLAERGQKLVAEFLERQSGQLAPGSMDKLNIGGAFFEMTARMLADPGKLIQAQMQLWQDYVGLVGATTRRFMGEVSEPIVTPRKDDKRFRDPAWQEGAIFDFIKQSYLLTARWMQSVVKDVEGLDERTAQKVDFYTRQFVDAVAPTNFVMTNPEVLRTTLETGGENLVKGLEHLLDDLERGKGQLLIKMTDPDAFKIGENIAVAPGKVVYQNALMQLIQYAPATETVHKRPLVILPPWINKFYILDLRPENSFVRWAVEQGHTVFVVSWVNPDGALADKNFEDYLQLGFLDVLDAVERATGERESNVIGYCLGGTLLASGLAYLAAKKQQKRVASATYFVALVDFTDVGEVRVFIDEAQLAALDEKMKGTGYLDAKDLYTTFNMLRANDLIWSFVVNNYLLGKEPFPFDLLYWNSDSTRMPAAMHSFYLHNMYQNNLLAEPGGITLKKVPIDLGKVKTPTYIVATKEDHIAPWHSVYQGTQLYGGPRRFVLGASGHIAGVVNPPAANKYGYWTNDDLPADPETWLATAEKHDGSWWTDWKAWIAPHGGAMVPARKPGDRDLKPIEDAPGSYVKQRAI